jgi:hypothetical protein
MLSHYGECYKLASYTECRYAECRYAECRGTVPNDWLANHYFLSKKFFFFFCECVNTKEWRYDTQHNDTQHNDTHH